MGTETKKSERMIARVMCQGGIAETAKKSDYIGIHSCIACGRCVRAVKQDHLSPNNLVPIRMILAPSSMAI